jgi:hypothetical protein
MLDGNFTTDELTAAVRAAACMSELLDALGIAATTASRRRMFQRLGRAGIDRSHWVHSPHSGYTREELARAVAASTSFAGVLRVLGRPQAGGTQAHVARRIRREGLDTSHFTGRGHNRGKPQRRLNTQEVLVVLHRARAAARPDSCAEPCANAASPTSAMRVGSYRSGAGSR